MTNEEIIKMTEPNKDQRRMIESVYNTLLEALRHREQEILRFIAILVPALGGFVWLLKQSLTNEYESYVFIVGTLGIQLFLLLGAVYSLALGYNFRQITFQLAKLESEPCLDISQYMLNGWPRRPEIFAKRYGKYCTPPEIIKVFWLAFIMVIIGITITVTCLVFKKDLFTTNEYEGILLIGWGVFCCIISLIAPIHYGHKIKDHADKEPSWEKGKASC